MSRLTFERDEPPHDAIKAMPMNTSGRMRNEFRSLRPLRVRTLRGRSEVLEESSFADVLLADELERVLQVGDDRLEHQL